MLQAAAESTISDNAAGIRCVREGNSGFQQKWTTWELVKASCLPAGVEQCKVVEDPTGNPDVWQRKLMKASKHPRKCEAAPVVRSIWVSGSKRSVRQTAHNSVGWQSRSCGCVKGRGRVLFCLLRSIAVLGNPLQTYSLPTKSLLPSITHQKPQATCKPLLGSWQRRALSRGEVWGGRSGPLGQMGTWSAALSPTFLCRRGPRAPVTWEGEHRDYGLDLVPAEALMKAQTVASASPLSSGIQSQGKAFGLIYDSSRYCCPSPKWVCGKCVIIHKIHHTERRTSLNYIENSIERLFLNCSGSDEHWQEENLSKIFLNQFPSIGNLKVFKELRVSQSQQCDVHICPSTGLHTPDFQLWLSKDIEMYLYLDHERGTSHLLSSTDSSFLQIKLFACFRSISFQHPWLNYGASKVC